MTYRAAAAEQRNKFQKWEQIQLDPPTSEVAIEAGGKKLEALMGLV